MQEKKIRSAKNIIKASVILRLLWNAFLANCMVSAYSDFTDNLVRISRGGAGLPIVIAGLLIDTILTVLWSYKRNIFTLHLVAYILLGWLYYGKMLDEMWIISGVGGLALLIVVPFLCFIGVIPFIVCDDGQKKLAKALAERNEM